MGTANEQVEILGNLHVAGTIVNDGILYYNVQSPKYNTVPVYTLCQIGHNIQINRFNTSSINSKSYYDCIGSPISLAIGTYIISYNISLRATESVSFNSVYFGLSNSITEFNGQGNTNSLFQKSIILSGVTTNTSTSYQACQTYCFRNVSNNVYLICYCDFSAGKPYLVGSQNTENIQGLNIPPCNISATRIA